MDAPWDKAVRQGMLLRCTTCAQCFVCSGFATVREVTNRSTGELFACKVMTLPKEGAQLSPDEFTRCVFWSTVFDADACTVWRCREDIFKEIEILMKVDHPNVMYMKECFIASDKVTAAIRLHPFHHGRHHVTALGLLDL